MFTKNMCIFIIFMGLLLLTNILSDGYKEGADSDNMRQTATSSTQSGTDKGDWDHSSLNLAQGAIFFNVGRNEYAP